jgi:hypothetical protein
VQHLKNLKCYQIDLVKKRKRKKYFLLSKTFERLNTPFLFYIYVFNGYKLSNFAMSAYAYNNPIKKKVPVQNVVS